MSCCYRVFRPTEEELQTLLEDFLSIQLKGI
jgi:hypothetical protein